MCLLTVCVYVQCIWLSDCSSSPCISALSTVSRGRHSRHASNTQPTSQVEQHRCRLDRLPHSGLWWLGTRQRQLPDASQFVWVSAGQSSHQTCSTVHQGTYITAVQSCCRSVILLPVLLLLLPLLVLLLSF